LDEKGWKRCKIAVGRSRLVKECWNLWKNTCTKNERYMFESAKCSDSRPNSFKSKWKIAFSICQGYIESRISDYTVNNSRFFARVLIICVVAVCRIVWLHVWIVANARFCTRIECTMNLMLLLLSLKKKLVKFGKKGYKKPSLNKCKSGQLKFLKLIIQNLCIIVISWLWTIIDLGSTRIRLTTLKKKLEIYTIFNQFPSNLKS